MATAKKHCTVLLVLGACLALAVGGCAPTIDSFRAEPNVICRGSTVRLSWVASTGGQLSSRPPTGALGNVPKEGSVDVSPEKPTTFRLDVSSLFGRASHEAGVDVRDVPSVPKQIGQSVADPSAGCDTASVWVTDNVPADFWDPQLRVGTVASSDSRSYHVEHGGKVGDVNPSTPSTAFAGLPVAGPWKLTTPLLPGEACGKNVPRNLVVDVYATCAR
jgi:hypothetical protein